MSLNVLETIALAAIVMLNFALVAREAPFNKNDRIVIGFIVFLPLAICATWTLSIFAIYRYLIWKASRDPSEKKFTARFSDNCAWLCKYICCKRQRTDRGDGLHGVPLQYQGGGAAPNAPAGRGEADSGEAAR